MSAESDKIKGKLKKAAGDLTDNDELRREGKVDELAGKAKDVVEKVKDKVSKRV